MDKYLQAKPKDTGRQIKKVNLLYEKKNLITCTLIILFFIGITACRLNKQNDSDNKLIRAHCSAIIKEYVDTIKDIEIKIPIVILADEKVQEKINEKLTLENLTGLTIEEIKQQKEDYGDYANDSLIPDEGLLGIDYLLSKNSDCALSIKFSIEKISYLASAMEGKYPIRYLYLNFDLNTGDEIKIEDIIKKEMINKLYSICDKKLKENYLKAKKENSDLFSMEADYEFDKENLSNFYLGEKGLYFDYDFGFFHCDAYASPDQTIELNKKELKELLLSNKYGL